LHFWGAQATSLHKSRQLGEIRVIRCSFGAAQRKDFVGAAAGNYRLAACAPRN